MMLAYGAVNQRTGDDVRNRSISVAEIEKASQCNGSQVAHALLH